jgi:hypothetical protein
MGTKAKNYHIWSSVTFGPFVRTSPWPVTRAKFRHVRYPTWRVTDELIETIQYSDIWCERLVAVMWLCRFSYTHMPCIYWFLTGLRQSTRSVVVRQTWDSPLAPDSPENSNSGDESKEQIPPAIFLSLGSHSASSPLTANVRSRMPKRRALESLLSPKNTSLHVIHSNSCCIRNSL